jgi:hypothetical protein
VTELLRNVYGAPIPETGFKAIDVEKQDIAFKSQLVDLTAKNVQIYFASGKSGPKEYEVALIFEYPKSEHNSVNPKIQLCLQAFAVGEKAKRAFTGGEVEEEGGEPEGEGAPPPI